MKWDIVFEPRLNEQNFLRELILIEGYSHYVREIPLPPAMRYEIDKLNIVRTIRGTTGLEGNTLSEERVNHIVESNFAKADAQSVDELEALGAKKVLEFIRSKPPIKDAHISEDLIRELHRLTTADCGYAHNEPGRFRKRDVTAGDYRCPDYHKVPALMTQFIDFINSGKARAFHPVVKAITAHFYLVSIHPFGEGNGRTSRGLEAHILYNGGYYNALGFYSLANFFYRQRVRYINELQSARFKHNGNLTAFAKFALEGFIEELEIIKQQVLNFYRLIAYRDYLTELAGKREIGDRVFSFLHGLTRGMKISQKGFRTRTDEFVAALWKGKSDRTLRADLREMQNKRLILIDASGNIRANIELMDRFSATNS
ncbi:MAG: Fic family protein [Actinomycetota bacterium]|nr:Fic family protein [Actinomycetota bacterium]